MQSLGLNIIEEATREKMKRLNLELSQEQTGSMIECPECHYISKNKRFSAKIFQDIEGKCLKCFACGIWRRLT